MLQGILRWGLIGFGIGWLGAAVAVGCLYGTCPANMMVAFSPGIAVTLLPFASVVGLGFAAVRGVVQLALRWKSR